MKNIFVFRYCKDYDNIINVYSVPDNFCFDVNLVKRFLDTKGIIYKVNEYLDWEVNVYTFAGRCYSINWLMRRNTYCEKDNIMKGEFVEWLKTIGVEEIKYTEII